MGLGFIFNKTTISPSRTLEDDVNYKMNQLWTAKVVYKGFKD